MSTCVLYDGGMTSSATAKPAKKPRNRYHHGDLRRALLLEAVRTIGQQGVDGLTLREVGQRLGVSRTALYRHFSDKSSLLAAVARDGFQRFAAALRQGWEEGGPSLRGFELMGVAYVRFAVENPSHYRVMFGDYRRLCAVDPDLQADAGASFDVLLQALITLQAAGAIRRDEPRQLALFVWSVVHGVAMLAIDGQLGQEISAWPAMRGVVDFALERMRTGMRTL